MKKYNKYKPTNNEWLGDIPQQWASIKLKYVSDYQEGPGIMANDFTPEGVPLIRISGAKSRILTKDGCNYLSNEKVQKIWNHFKLQEGDLVISGSATSGLIAKVTNDCVGSILYTGLIRFRKTDSIEQDFLEVFLSSRLFNEQVDVQKSGTAIQHFGPTHLSNVFLALPPKDEQKSMANYANYKVSLIDSLISKNQKQIELLEEKKQAMINQSVTKGLDPNVKMKDSGIEWIGTIPEHWQVGAIRYLVGNVSSGTTPRSDNSSYYSIEDGIPWIQSGDLKNKFLTQTSKNITDEALMDYSILRTYPKGSLVIAMYGATIGACSLTKIEATTNQACAVISGSIKIDHEFLYYVFLNAKKELLKLSVGGGQPNISQEIIKALHISFPKIEEQKNIVLFINEKLEGINKVIQKLTKQQELLYEYRQALISNVVTGKIDVRDEKIPEKYITN